MPGFALLMLQAASTVTTPAPDERLLHPVLPRHCEGSASEIVVCAHDQEAYRLHGSGPQIEPTLPAKAEWRLFGDTKMNLHAEQRSLGGVAAMATITVPF